MLFAVSTGGCSKQEPPPPPRTAADILSDLRKEQATGHPEAALRLAQNLTNIHSGTPEADTAANQIPKLEAAVDSLKETERLRAAEAATAAEARRLANKWFYRVDNDPM